MLISTLFMVGCTENIERIPCIDTYEEYIIIDILKYEVDSWGSDGCVFESNRGKISVKGDSQCMSQIGDILYKEIQNNNSCGSYISNYFHKNLYSNSQYKIIQLNGGN